MRGMKYSFLTAIAAAAFLFVPAPKSHAQISVGVNLGPAPDCPYGYYDYAPYNCAPYGYYGPEWFHGGVFLGAGPWFHGPHGFYGHVNHAFDPHFGYHGGFPAHGGYHEPPDHFHSFHATHMRDGHGHEHR